ncbi:hypothetical protein RvY_11073 [Ramazzottius varieornatus]|uniref:Uncharacterized protein n=1 Tax=Ramazzottius varieornatus TaxID=947166 RepID=A0A1D1VNT7_RAMVA|nr:hypothetical protein RvY_11073 [Ramazzottius varieornatus]
MDISMMRCRTCPGSGRPLTKTPPSWFVSPKAPLNDESNQQQQQTHIQHMETLTFSATGEQPSKKVRVTQQNEPILPVLLIP